MPWIGRRVLAVAMLSVLLLAAMPLTAVGLVGTPPPVMPVTVVGPPDGATDDQFGHSVAIDGNTAVVGAPGYDGEGAAFVYEFNGHGWVLSQKLPADPAAGDRFGAAVDIDGGHIVVGAPYDNVGTEVDRGTAVVFQRTPSGWTYLTELVPSSASAGDRFGWSVSVYGTTAVVGAPLDDDLATDSGAIYVFREGESSPVKHITASSGTGGEYGYAVDVRGNYMVASAPLADTAGGVGAGVVKVYYGDGATPWTINRTIYSSSPHVNDGFGHSVSTNGSTILVGISGYDASGQESAGGAEVFVRSGSGTSAVWPSTQLLTSPEPNAYDYFGWSVSINGSVAIVGAEWDGAAEQGSAHVYQAGPAGWTFIQKIDGSGWFGTSVAASQEGRFVVGAMTADMDAPDSGTATFLARLDPVYRFYNAGAGTHFFTDSVAERDHVIATWPTIYSFEGIAYSVNPYNNKQPLYRFYKPSSSSHFYTASEEERDHVIATWPHIYQYDGPTYEVSPSPEAAKPPVYRFYNVRNGSHFYTASATERDHVIATWPGVYSYEGPAFWLGQ